MYLIAATTQETTRKFKWSKMTSVGSRKHWINAGSFQYYEWVLLPGRHESNAHNLPLRILYLTLVYQCGWGQTHVPLSVCGHLGQLHRVSSFLLLETQVSGLHGKCLYSLTFCLSFPLFLKGILSTRQILFSVACLWPFSLPGYWKPHFLYSLNIALDCVMSLPTFILWSWISTFDTLWNKETQRKAEEHYSALSLTESAHLWQQMPSVTCCLISPWQWGVRIS